ncbi:MAG: pyruvate kinase [Ectothiorhodospira sp.]
MSESHHTIPNASEEAAPLYRTVTRRLPPPGRTPGEEEDPATWATLLKALEALHEDVIRGGKHRLLHFTPDYPGEIPLSAHNLAHYLAFRSLDLRPLQLALAARGLSSLGRIEAHVLSSIHQVMGVLGQLAGRPAPPGETPPAIDFATGERTLAENADRLFGSPSAPRDVRIMVTLPSEAAVNGALIQSLMERGMNCARINCAHDGPEQWAAMIAHLRRAEARVGRRCTLLMDLAGHKLRTGPLALRPAVAHLKPQRNLLGWVTEAAGITLVPEDGPQGQGLGITAHRFTAPSAVLERFATGDRLRCRDTRGKRRKLWVVEALPGGGWQLTLDQGAYITDETEFTHERRGEDGAWQSLQTFRLGWLTREPVNIRLHKGALLRLTRTPLPGCPAQTDDSGHVTEPAHIGRSAPEALDHLMPGQAVWIDDGRIGAEVETLDTDGITLRITHCRPQGNRLRADKGINFPGADLNLPPLSRQDLENLDFVAAHADLVGFSFVESREDMATLMEALAQRGGDGLGIVAKIETRRAVEHLPEIILPTLGRHRLGVMIARGDLAVEIGGERLAEIQEEILWVCEAAHVPVIWATQVLETLAKSGGISRPELTDAAMAGRAECVMLNKGPYILDAVTTLNDILVRMQAHQHKKTSRLRALRLAGD